MTIREKIIEEAITLFSQKGYASTSIVDLSIAAGLSPSAGGLYRHFPSKEAILKAILNQSSRNLIEFHKKAFALDFTLPRDQLIQMFCGLCVAACYDLRDYYRVIVNEIPKYPEVAKHYNHEDKAQTIEVFANNFKLLLSPNKEDADFRVLGHIYMDSCIQRVLFASDLNILSDEEFVKEWAAILESALIATENSH